MSTRSVLRASTGQDSTRATAPNDPARDTVAPSRAADPATGNASSVTSLDAARRAARNRGGSRSRTLAAHRTAPRRRGLDAVRAAGPGGATGRIRRCSRPNCSEEARATLTFSYDNRTALLGPLRPEPNPAAYDMCGACSDRMSPPRGWQLADERPPVAPTPLRREFDERDTVAVLADALHGGATRDERGRLPDATVDVTDRTLADEPPRKRLEDHHLPLQELPETTPAAAVAAAVVVDVTGGDLPPPVTPPVLQDVPLPGFDELLAPRPVRAVRDRDGDA